MSVDREERKKLLQDLRVEEQQGGPKNGKMKTALEVKMFVCPVTLRSCSCREGSRDKHWGMSSVSLRISHSSLIQRQGPVTTSIAGPKHCGHQHLQRQ